MFFYIYPYLNFVLVAVELCVMISLLFRFIGVVLWMLFVANLAHRFAYRNEYRPALHSLDVTMQFTTTHLSSGASLISCPCQETARVGSKQR